MSPARAAFQAWRDAQTFYREAILDAATYYEDGHGHLVIWHEQLGVLKTIPFPNQDELKANTSNLPPH
jgi:hypothetical protein